MKGLGCVCSSVKVAHEADASSPDLVFVRFDSSFVCRIDVPASYRLNEYSDLRIACAKDHGKLDFWGETNQVLHGSGDDFLAGREDNHIIETTDT